MAKQQHGLGYWRDVALIGLGVLCVVAGIGHVLDWIGSHQPKDPEIAMGFLLVFPLLFALTPRRLELLVAILLAIVLFGTVGTILMHSLAGLPLILPSAAFAYLLLKWKGKELKE